MQKQAFIFFMNNIIHFENQKKKKFHLSCTWLMCFSSSPGEAAGIVTAQDVEGRVIWVCSWRTDHLHETQTLYPLSLQDPVHLKHIWNPDKIYTQKKGI